MIKKLISILLLCCFTPAIFAVNISDVPKTDPDNKAIQQAVSEGYLSLFSNQNFNGDSPITRREASLIISKLISEMDGSGVTLSKAELQELATLSKTFKSYMSENIDHREKSKNELENISNEQVVIQHDLTETYSKFNDTLEANKSLKANQGSLESDLQKLNQSFEAFKQETYDNQVYLWAGIAIGTLLGVLVGS